MSLEAADDLDWRADAACLEHDPAVFFPEQHESAWLAKKICSGCPVRTPCLLFALNIESLEGIFGGTSFRERMKLRVNAA